MKTVPLPPDLAVLVEPLRDMSVNKMSSGQREFRALLERCVIFYSLLQS